jgi:alginate O-acetyltransferase complex protein AlgI
LPLLLTNKNRKNLEIVAKGRIFPNFKEISSILSTFGLTVLAWIFFRANSLAQAWIILTTIFSPSLLTTPDFDGIRGAFISVLLIILFLITEWSGREYQYPLENLESRVPSRHLRWGIYSFIILLIGMYMQTQETPFIYFQF